MRAIQKFYFLKMRRVTRFLNKNKFFKIFWSLFFCGQFVSFQNCQSQQNFWGVESASFASQASLQQLTLLAGDYGGSGYIDGPGLQARFHFPGALAVDNTGNVFVADTLNSVIRKIDTAGNVTTIAGKAGSPGSVDGPGPLARFFTPSGITIDPSGNIFVSDAQNSNIRKISPTGVVSTYAGKAGNSGSDDGFALDARFDFPIGIVSDSHGNIFVADTFNYCIREITNEGQVVTIAGMSGMHGSTNGVGSDARFEYPAGITINSAGVLVVSDANNASIRVIDTDMNVTTLAGNSKIGSADGPFTSASFSNPMGVVINGDGSGSVFVADTSNFVIRKLGTNGQVTTVAGKAGMRGTDDGMASNSRFNNPTGIASDSSGNIYVADTNNSTIRKISPNGLVTTIAGSTSQAGSVDGTGIYARFNVPEGIVSDTYGNIYVADTNNSVIRQVTPLGVVTTFAGSSGNPGSSDGMRNMAKFNQPNGVTIDPSGNIYVLDSGNNTIRKIDPTGLVSTLAGQAGIAGSADGTGSAAKFNSPQGIATDSAGNIYVADTGNSTIRKINPNGMTSTFGGSAGSIGSVDGNRTAAKFNFPQGVAVDYSGNVFVTDTGNSTIRKISSKGVVSTIAGQVGVWGTSDGSGKGATFSIPWGITIDSSGNVLITDASNPTVRKVNSQGIVTTVLGVYSTVAVGKNSYQDALSSTLGITISNGNIVLVSGNAILISNP